MQIHDLQQYAERGTLWRDFMREARETVTETLAQALAWRKALEARAIVEAELANSYTEREALEARITELDRLQARHEQAMQRFEGAREDGNTERLVDAELRQATSAKMAVEQRLQWLEAARAQLACIKEPDTSALGILTEAPEPAPHGRRHTRA